MIFSTNRTASLGDDIAVDVNESYFGAGALSFMQENAQDELALFEAAIRSDIDEAYIDESATDELTALNEGFVQNAANKIKEMMRKFIEWLQAVTRSAIAKLTQLLVKDNEKFIKIAQNKIYKMKNSKNFKYTGKAVKISGSKISATDLCKEFDGLFEKASKAKSKEEVDNIVADINTKLEKFEKLSDRDEMIEEVIIDVKDEGITFVQGQLDFLKSNAKKDLDDLRKTMKDFENKAKKMSKEADSKAKSAKGDSDDDKAMKESLNAMAIAASKFREASQTWVNDTLYLLKTEIKVARSVVSKAMGASPKNEGFEYSEEFTDAMIEYADYVYDEALEEMSEGKECDDCEPGAEPDEDEE